MISMMEFKYGKLYMPDLVRTLQDCGGGSSYSMERSQSLPPLTQMLKNDIPIMPTTSGYNMISGISLLAHARDVGMGDNEPQILLDDSN
jgi:hypothetical protein